MQRRSLLAALPAALLPAMAQAQTAFPDHAVTITVPFSAGGPRMSSPGWWRKACPRTSASPWWWRM
ncbi:hypothetical protein ACFQU7_32175 [Pseudoroseomonas wenyumeiae]